MPTSYSLHFAPLQGYTDAIYRNAHARFFGGADRYYTPFIRLEKGNFRNKDLHDIDPGANETALVPQLLGGTPGEIRQMAALLVSKGYRCADLNLGCPFVPIARKHKGAGLLPFPEEVKALLDAMKTIPELVFSLKMRLGWQDASESVALLPLIGSFPFSRVTIHARTGVQQYKGATDLNGFEEFYRQCALPLYYNGDIRSLDDLHSLAARFPALQGFVVGRGLLENPALALEYKLGGPHGEKEKRPKIRDFHAELFARDEARLQVENQFLSKLKTLWDYLLPEADRKLRKKITKSTRLSQYTEAVSSLLDE